MKGKFMSQTYEITASFPFKSHFATVNGSKIHYIDEGSGQPIVFLHDIPTWSYIWRNVIPPIKNMARCIAPDLIGFGKSDKPDISYRVFDHIDYIEKFIEQLDLKNIILVLHGWGSVIGFEYFRRHPKNVKGIVFMEAHIRPPSGWDTLSLPVQELASIMSSPDGGYDVIMNSNYFVNKVLPSGVLRRLSEEEMLNYSAPFQSPGSTKPIWQYLQDLPLGDGPDDVVELISKYSETLQKTNIPKLMLYAIPGYITTIATIEWAKENFNNLSTVDLGEGLHYLQETDPLQIAQEIINWYQDMDE